MPNEIAGYLFHQVYAVAAPYVVFVSRINKIVYLYLINYAFLQKFYRMLPYHSAVYAAMNQ